MESVLIKELEKYPEIIKRVRIKYNPNILKNGHLHIMLTEVNNGEYYIDIFETVEPSIKAWGIYIYSLHSTWGEHSIHSKDRALEMLVKAICMNAPKIYMEWQLFGKEDVPHN